MKFADEESRIVELIAQERELSGISYAELGRRLGIDWKRMWYVLNGKRRIYVDEFVRLCAYFDLGIGRFATKELRELVRLYRKRDQVV